MQKIVRILKMIGLTILGVVLVLVVIATLFINVSPEFGGKSTQKQQTTYEKSENYKDEKFVNKNEVKLSMSTRDILKSLTGFLRSQPKTTPKIPIAVEKIDSINIADYKGDTRLVWFGHSSFLLQINNKTILIDPMLGDVPAPHPSLGGKRFSNELPIEIEKIPQIDAVLISHDHYDHLDYGSIKKLKDKVQMFYTPLGVGVHLEAWGVKKENIVELDWWDSVPFKDLKFICTPAQHFSGRGLTDRTKTLWSSWIIQSESENIFFSGDSGYADHFKTIGDKYGPFDFAMLECGQYNEMWPEVHMFPEETAQAALDIKAKRMMPIHWGAFKLSMHPWTDPVERILKKAQELKVSVIIPEVGEIVLIKGDNLSAEKWWKQYDE